ncbi:MAG: phosphoribosylformylglycinamidine cyclo-ligase, partial [Proteobacteria bacterium]|nr:phosphoribosylformylglycinamidine cyclo-ligase [Pseudomonadota bacterium]
TGGGITDNLVRIIPKGCRVIMKKGTWDVPPIFSFLQEAGKIEDLEMLRTFNNGIGLIAVVPEPSTQELMDRLAAMNEKAFVIGEITENKKSEQQISWE